VRTNNAYAPPEALSAKFCSASAAMRDVVGKPGDGSRVPPARPSVISQGEGVFTEQSRPHSSETYANLTEPNRHFRRRAKERISNRTSFRFGSAVVMSNQGPRLRVSRG